MTQPTSTRLVTEATGPTYYTALGKVATTVTASGAAVVGKHNPVDATTGAKSLSLPTGQSEGTQVSVEKTDATANVVSVTGSLRGVAAQSVTLAWAHEAITLRADSAGSWWPVAGHKTKSSLDAAYVNQIVAVGGDERARLNTFLAASSPIGVKKLIGSFSVSDSLTIPSNTHLDLSGATITQTGTSKITLDVNAVSNVTIVGGQLVGTGVHIPGSTLSLGITVRGGSNNIHISRVSLTGHGGVGIKVDGSTDAWVDGCRIVGTSPPAAVSSLASQFGILVETTASRVTLSNNNITATSQGIITSILSSAVTITDNRIWTITGQHGMYVQSKGPVSITGNVVTSTAYIGIKVQINSTAVADMKGIHVSDNTIDTTGSHGIFVGSVDPAYAYYIRDVIISNNTILNTTEDGINLEAVTNARIAGNTIRGVTRYGISLKQCSDLEVVDNTLHTVSMVGMYLQTSTGVMERIAIEGNSLRDMATSNTASNNYGIYVTQGTDVSILRNRITSSTGTVMRYGVFFATGDQASLTFVGNNISGATDYAGRFISATTSKVFVFNYLAGTLGKILNPPTNYVANADTSGATLTALETEVNELKATLRAAGFIA